MANAVILPGERLAGLSADLFHKLQAGSLTLDELALFTQRKNPFKTTPVFGLFRLTIDYGQPFERMIAAGRYDWKNGDITAKRFPITGKGVVEFEGRYFHFNRYISSENAIQEIEAADTANPWSAAKIEHVLSHGTAFPEKQRKFPIIGLGSVAEVDGDRSVPGLDKYGSERGLGLDWFDDDWDPICRFLAVREVSVP
ncbi:hypothetical protein HY415_00365 [Candidatus Kaiserbacteria bacterium]|nr:hypothetical protein [Candidatus Kaiserbacteria bacterium]